MSRRTRQVGDLLREELDDIIRQEVKDPRVGFFTHHQSRSSPDIRQASAYISVLGTDDERARHDGGARSASGFIRRQLKPRLRMRQIPEIAFRRRPVDGICRNDLDRACSELKDIGTAAHRPEERRADGTRNWSIDRRLTPSGAWRGCAGDDDLHADPSERRCRRVRFSRWRSVTRCVGSTSPASCWSATASFPIRLRFLPGSSQAVIYGQTTCRNTTCSAWSTAPTATRLGDFYTTIRSESKVDRRSSTSITTSPTTTSAIVNIVEPKAACHGGNRHRAARPLGHRENSPVAQCLLAGIYGDTLGLRTESTTSRTMRMAADLVDAGANPTSITDALFRLKPASTVCLWRHALDGVAWTGPLIWTSITGECWSLRRRSV